MPPTLHARPLGLGLLCLLAACGGESGGQVEASQIYTVGRGDLLIQVREQAELEAAENTIVASQVEGETRLIYLIREGTRVKPGDKVAELDVSGAEEKRASQAIDVAKALAARDAAKKSVEIMEKELRAEEKTAETRKLLAEMQMEKLFGNPKTRREDGQSGGTNAEMVAKLEELVKSERAAGVSIAQNSDLVSKVKELLGDEKNLALEMGEMANQILTMIDEISLARVDLELAKDTLEHSRRLRADGHITKNELERDEISHKRQFSKVTLAWNNLQLLVQYTLPETKIQRQQEVANADLGLQSVRAAGEARRVKEHADLRSAEAEYGLAKQRLDTLDSQIKNGVVRAPSEGLVVYARPHRWRSAISVGSDIDERQPIVILPDVRKMIARVMVHEAQISKVAVGQQAVIRLDAFPGRLLQGEVTIVSSLPDSGSRRGNRDLKVYEVVVQLDRDNTDGELRPGMSATVQIDVGVLEDVVNIPMLALQRRGNRSYVYKWTPEGPVPEVVALGANNLTRVEVIEGLSEGDQIYLVPPPGALPLPLEDGEDGGDKQERGEERETNEATVGENGGDKAQAEGPAKGRPDGKAR